LNESFIQSGRAESDPEANIERKICLRNWFPARIVISLPLDGAKRPMKQQQQQVRSIKVDND